MYNDVSIVPDLTPSQRKEEAALHEEMDRKNRDELTEEEKQKTRDGRWWDPEAQNL
jgi:hypothetical protein